MGGRGRERGKGGMGRGGEGGIGKAGIGPLTFWLLLPPMHVQQGTGMLPPFSM